MKFTIIGHACLFIETGSETILVDPWLSGSCYWRSWWHFPPNTAIRPAVLEPDYIYLSHHHFDHFHYPSLRRLSRKARVLIPRFGLDIMRFELANLGFEDVTELPHGDVMKLTGGTRLASYQYGPDDSAFVVERDGVVLADLNDCKINGASARPLLREFRSPTFFFKSHSFAQAYPNCYTFADPADAQYMTRDDFVATFIGEAREMQPKYAIPFASMVAFLHPESRACNQYAVGPPEVVAAVNAPGAVPGSEAVLMIPGDTWDSHGGFDPGARLLRTARRMDRAADCGAVGAVSGRGACRERRSRLVRAVRDLLRSVPSFTATVDLAGSEQAGGVLHCERPQALLGTELHQSHGRAKGSSTRKLRRPDPHERGDAGRRDGEERGRVHAYFNAAAD